MFCWGDRGAYDFMKFNFKKVFNPTIVTVDQVVVEEEEERSRDNYLDYWIGTKISFFPTLAAF